MSQCQHCQETEDSTHPISAKVIPPKPSVSQGVFHGQRRFLEKLIPHSLASGISANGLPLNINL
jgi:hypothetical protein